MVEAFLLLLLGHMLGDYVFQTSQIAQNKSKKLKYLAIHTFVLWGCGFLAIAPCWTMNTFFWTLLLAMIHGGIDLIKYQFRTRPFTTSVRYFILDQVMHVSSIWVIAQFISLERPFLPPSIAFVMIVVIVHSYLVDIITYLIHDARNGRIYSRDLLNYLLLGVSFPIIVFHPVLGIVFFLGSLGIQILWKRPNRNLLTKYLLCAGMNGVFFSLWRWMF